MKQPWLESADFSARRKDRQAKLLEAAIKNLLTVYRDQVALLELSEDVTEAMNSIRRAIFCLAEESRFKNELAGKAQLQNLGMLPVGYTGQDDDLPPLN